MALTILNGFEPGADDPRIWDADVSASSLTGWSAPTTTTSTLAPSDARRWMKAIDTGSATSIVICQAGAITPDTYVWYVQRDVVIEGTIPVGFAADYLGLSQSVSPFDLILRVIRGSAGDKYKIELRTEVGGSGTLVGTTSELTTATKHHVRVQTDGINWTLWVNGTQEVQGAQTGDISNHLIQLWPPTASSGVEHYWATGALSMSTNELDRPDSSDVEVHDFEPDTSGSESEAGWGDQADCTPGSTTAAIADVTLDGSDKVDTATFWCEVPAETEAETVDTVTFAFTTGFSIGGGLWRGVVEASVTAKTVTTAARIYDGTSGTNVTLTNIGSDTFEGRHRYFQNAPGGGSWNQTEADGLKIGMQNEGEGGNGANTECAAITFTLVGLSNDSLPHRRAHPMAPLIVR